MTAAREKESARFALAPLLGGVETLRADFVSQRFSRHFHEGYAIGRIQRGALRFRYLGRDLEAAPGEVNLVMPGETHDGQGADASGWSYRMIYVKPEALAEASRALSPKPFLPDFSMGVLRDPQLAAQVLAAQAALESPDVSLLEKETRLIALLADWISRHACQRLPWPKITDDAGPAAKARDYIRANAASDVRLDDLARASGASPFHLARLFSRRYGLPPHAYLTQCRLELARKLIRDAPDGGADLAGIALDSGFADQSHMTRLFKRRYGVTPGALRKIVQES